MLHNPRLILLIFVLFLTAEIPAPAQSRQADSLYLLIRNHTGQDTTLVRLYYHYSLAILPVSPESCFRYNEKALSLAVRLKDQYSVIRSLGLIARKHMMRGEYDSALSFYRKSFDLAKKAGNSEYKIKNLLNIGLIYRTLGLNDSVRFYMEAGLQYAREYKNDQMTARALSELGTIYSITGDFIKAITLHMEAMEIYERNNLKADQMVAHVRLGNLFNKLGNFSRSKAHYMKSLALNGPDGDRNIEMDVIQNLGLLYQQVKKDPDSALIFLRKALRMAENAGNLSSLLSIWVNTGNVYFDLADYRKAVEYYIKAYQSPIILARKYELAAVKVNLGTSWLNLGEMEKAENLLREGLALADTGNFTEFQKIACLSLATLSEKRGDYREAYKYARRSILLNDSISSRDMKDLVLEVQFRYEMEKMENQNALLAKQNELHGQTILKQRILVISSLVVLALIILLLAVILRSRRKQNALIRKLDEQNVQLQEAILTRDKFFSILAHDLKSPFSGLLGLLDMLDEDAPELDESSRREMIHSLRRTSHNTYNLLENLLEWSRMHRGIINYEPRDIALCEVVDHVFRILESRAAIKSQSLVNEVEPGTRVHTDKNIISALLINLVNNGIKFTPRNGTIRVFTRTPNDKLMICVEDTGVGIEEEDIPKLFRIDVSYQRQGTEREPGTGLGLIMCREYITLMGESIFVSSQVGKGTTISFTVTPAQNEGPS